MSLMSEIKKLIKGIKVNFSEDEYGFLTNIAKDMGDIPVSRLARSIILEYIENNKSSSDIDLVELKNQVDELLAWKKEVESSINLNPPSLKDEDLDIDWDEINENNIRNQEIIKKLEQRLKPQQNEEVYVPGSLDDDLGLKDKI